jgi:dihydroorotate dehydrogenase electron transfer subunit
MKMARARIVANHKVASGFYRMDLASPYLAANTKPGQFLEVKCPEDSGVLLRRPFSCHMVSKNGISILYEVLGKGTESLASLQPKDEIDILGPLGKGFDIPAVKNKRSFAVLVAGGIGVAPLVALAQRLSKKIRTIALVGACKKEHLLCENEFKKFGAKVNVATEDGSRGVRGFVTGLLEKVLSENKNQSIQIYTCGPVGMLKTVAGIARAYHVNCQVSMEERMACGVGVCLGCPVEVRGSERYKMVCKDGPVFDAKEIAW